MEQEFNAIELGQLLRALRVIAPDFNEEMFSSLIVAQHNLNAAGFLEAVWGIVRLQEEQGIDLSQVIDTYQEFLSKKEKLEKEISTIENKRVTTAQEFHRISNNLSVAKNELQAIQKETSKEEKQLASFIAHSETVKSQINLDLEQQRIRAKITTEDIAAAKQLKDEVEKSGFSLNEMIDLVKEFAHYPDARERLVNAIKTSGSLTEYIVVQQQKAVEQNKALTATNNQLLSLKTSENNEIKQLKEIHHVLENNLAQLRIDLEDEQHLRQFQVRYSSLSQLLEYLGGWPQIYFLRCDNPFCAPLHGITHFWTDKPARKCPYCGLSLLNYDAEVYRLLNMPADKPLKLLLG